MELFTLRVTFYGLLLLSTFWSVADCRATASSLTRTDVTSSISTVTTLPPTTPSLPDDVKKVEVVGQTENSVTIEFDRVDGIKRYAWGYDGAIQGNITVTEEAVNPINHTLDNLMSARKYSMTLYSVADDGRTSPGRLFNAVTAPRNAEGFRPKDQNETSITLQWDPVPDVTDYVLQSFHGEINVTGQEETMTDLTSGTLYSFTLFAVFENVRSSGSNLNAATAPRNAEGFRPKDQNETSITLQWDPVPDVTDYVLQSFHGEINVTGQEETMTDLTSGTLYNFTLLAVFENVRSSGSNLNAATAPRNAEGFRPKDQNETSITLQWDPVPDVTDYVLQSFHGEINVTGQEETMTDLTSGTLYSFTLFAVFENVPSSGSYLNAATAPRNAERFRAVAQNETSITLRWDPVPNVSHYEIKMSFRDGINVTDGYEETITDLSNGTWYDFTLFAVFENVRSSGSILTAATVPRNTEEGRSVGRSETSITLKWKPVPNVTHYVIKYLDEEINVTDRYEETIPDLSSGTLYDFTIFSVFATFPSTGYHLRAATVPSQVSSVTVTNRALTSITLQWTSLRDTWKYLVSINNGNPTTATPIGGSVSHTFLSLKEGTLYTYSITTEFDDLKSATYKESTPTTIDCGKVDWRVTETSIEGKVEGVFTKAMASNGSSHDSSGSNPEVKFTGLYPGAKYDLKLMYNELEQCTHSLTIIPPAMEAQCKDWNAGYSIYIEWNSPIGIWDSVEISVSGQQYIVGTNGERYAEIANFQPAKTYEVSICSKSESQKSKSYVFTCATDAKGVIAGAFFGVLLFLILICAVAFVVLRRPDLIRRKKHMGGARTSLGRSKGIPLEKFPAHFNMLSADENKGFSIEYEDLALVGTTQSQKAATTPENKPKNRFVNVLPYDRSRVKMTSSSPNSDYINASYMPGYNSDREFIATQGPMPSTASDFWRMIWEQKVKGIIMVTNCTEGGRTKCEQYWPDSGPRVCGDLAVYTSSQQKDSDWTLREFTVKHRHTSEERTVKHFHFTAWPDHGVPQGTEVLIQFRSLVRKHIQSEAAGSPTVVHCSAGVGRTGTIIALDTMLQQMEKENMVDINGFVYKMRLNRPHMVQTESQYVFLHQCIMDSLRPTTTYQEEENIYENEIIYANATALREYQDSLNKA